MSGVASARTAWSRRNGLLLELLDGDRRIGVGEATPLPGFSLDDLSAARAELGRLPTPSRLPADTPAVAALLDALHVRSPSARFAVETALLDAAARSRGVAVGALFGARRHAVPRTALVGALDDRELVARALHAVGRGARAIKLKVAAAPLDEQERHLEALSRAIGQRASVRVDFNGGLDLDSVHQVLELHARAGVEWAEEPVSGRGLLELGETALPWLADESLADPTSCAALLESRHSAGVVLKPTVLGGLIRCAEVAARAARAGKRIVISHAFEGPVALAAAAELSLALDARWQPAAGLDLHPALAAFPSLSVSQLPHARASADGVLSVLPTQVVGLGIDPPRPDATARAGLA